MANLPQNYQHNPNYAMTISDLEKIGEYIVKSGLFGFDKKEQAIALLLLAQSEGLHPMQAVKKYHIVQGKPVKKSETMLSDFIQAGGRVKWHKMSDKEVEATFTAPNGDSITIKWTWEMAEKITTRSFDKFAKEWVVKKLTDKDNWKNYPRQMLRARVISEGIRSIFPEITGGFYTPEEVIDFTAEDTPVVDITEDNINTNNSNSNPEPEPGKNISSENEPATLNKEWTIQEVKKVITPELKEKFSSLKLKQKTIISLFNDFNGNQEEILKFLNESFKETSSNTEAA